MMLAIEVTAVPDDPHQPTYTETHKLSLSRQTVEEVLSGKLPFSYQVFVEATIPGVIRDVLNEVDLEGERRAANR